MATPLLQSACLLLRREGAQTMRRVQRVSPLPNRAFDKSQLRQLGFRAQMIQHRLGDFEAGVRTAPGLSTARMASGTTTNAVLVAARSIWSLARQRKTTCNGCETIA